MVTSLWCSLASGEGPTRVLSHWLSRTIIAGVCLSGACRPAPGRERPHVGPPLHHGCSVAETRIGERFTIAPRPWWGLWKALQNTVPRLFFGPPISPTGPRLGELEGLGKKAGIRLLPYSPPYDQHSAVVWILSLTIAHWRLPVGEARWGANQWLSRTRCLIIGYRVMMHSSGCVLKAELTELLQEEPGRL